MPRGNADFGRGEPERIIPARTVFHQYARVTGSPGEAPRVAGLLRIIWPFILLIFAWGYLFRAAWPTPDLNTTMIGGAFLALAGVLAWSVTIGRRRLDSFLKGAKGEEWVARTLSFLPTGFHVYHGITAPSSLFGQAADYDHVVVGPTGVFLVETKNWTGRIDVRDGRILYNGEEPDRPPLDQVKNAAAELRGELRDAVYPQLEVQPVLCFAEGAVPSGCTGAAGVMICSSYTLNDLLQEKPDVPLPKDVQDAIVYYLDQRTERS